MLAYGYKAVYSYFLNRNNVPWAAETAGDCAAFNLISFAFGTVAWYAIRMVRRRIICGWLSLLLPVSSQ